MYTDYMMHNRHYNNLPNKQVNFTTTSLTNQNGSPTLQHQQANQSTNSAGKG